MVASAEVTAGRPGSSRWFSTTSVDEPEGRFAPQLQPGPVPGRFGPARYTGEQRAAGVLEFPRIRRNRANRDPAAAGRPVTALARSPARGVAVARDTTEVITARDEIRP